MSLYDSFVRILFARSSVYSFIRPFVCSFVLSFFGLFVCWFVRGLVDSLLSCLLDYSTLFICVPCSLVLKVTQNALFGRCAWREGGVTFFGGSFSSFIN